MEPVNFAQQLKEILDVLVSVSWLNVVHKGAIFVANNHRELVLVAQHGLGPGLKVQCSKVPFGLCLCGKAAEAKTILFRDCVDGDHDIHCDGAIDHGHYNIPLLDNKNEVIGVIVLYLQAGHQPHREEANLMEMLGRAVSGILLNRNLQLQARINRIRWQRAQLDVLHKLVAASEFRDSETGEHIKRMSQYAVVIGRKYGLGEDQLELLEQAAPMHDIGKMGIPDQILLKPGRLTEEEVAIMQQHTVIGASILSGTHPLIEAGRAIALTHHEKWDGSGYPRGLKGEEIPLFGRICALADVFDALTMERPYKKAWPLEKALSWIRDNTGTHFDPELVAAFMDGLPEILQIKEIYNDSRSDGRGKERLVQVPVESATLGWDESFSVGVDYIDRQHMYLINLINRIHEAIERFDPKATVETILDMKSYTEVHFAEEEELMKQYGYPDLEAHVRQHQGFIRKTEMFLNDLEAAPLATTSEVASFLLDWLVTHIQKVDAQYGTYIRERAAADREVLV